MSGKLQRCYRAGFTKCQSFNLATEEVHTMSIYTLMRLFTIRFRMLSAIGVVLVLMAVIGGVGMLGMLRLHDLSGHFITHSFAQAGQLGQLRSALGNVRAHEKDMLLAQGQPEALAQA